MQHVISPVRYQLSTILYDVVVLEISIDTRCAKMGDCAYVF